MKFNKKKYKKNKHTNKEHDMTNIIRTYVQIMKKVQIYKHISTDTVNYNLNK